MAFLAGVISCLFNQNMIIQSFTISSKSIHQHSLSIIVGSWPSHYMYMLIISRKFDMCAVISIVIIINLLSSERHVITVVDLNVLGRNGATTATTAQRKRRLSIKLLTDVDKTSIDLFMQLFISRVYKEYELYIQSIIAIIQIPPYLRIVAKSKRSSLRLLIAELNLGLLMIHLYIV